MNHSGLMGGSPTNVLERVVDVFRLRDIIGASAGLTLCAPLFAAVAVAIRADSPGPVFFRQQRVGRDGKLFSIHKFRTMQAANDGLAVSVSNDPRITRIGRILRATKVDELPQFIDVLRGDMALVGPRPEVPIYADLWPADLRPLILSVRPGITDPATVVLRHEAVVLARSTDPERTYVEEFLPLKAHEYSVYVRNRTFIGDLRILIETLRAVCSLPSHLTHSQLMNARRGNNSR